MPTIESVQINQTWFLLFRLADGLVDVIEDAGYALTGRYVLPDPENDDLDWWVDRLVDYLERRSGHHVVAGQ